jgi:hypothetical protein
MRTHAVAAKDGSLGWRVASRQSEALGRGIRVEQGEFLKTLLGFYDRSVLDGSMAWGCERLGEVNHHHPCEPHKPCEPLILHVNYPPLPLQKIIQSSR